MSVKERKGFTLEQDPKGEEALKLQQQPGQYTKSPSGSPKDTNEHPLRASAKLLRVPEERPPFTVGDLKRAIPKHCFERSLLRSSLYLVIDVAIISALFYATRFFDHPSLPPFVPYVLWTLYWLVQGYVMTGLWVIAHECGHSAFSDYDFVNDLVGWLGHSFLLVPYFSWKITHAKHHSKTANMDADAVFVPRMREENEDEALPSVFWTLGGMVVTFTVGWFMYLAYNETAPVKPDEPRPNHFNPYCSLFTPKERHLVIYSDIGLLIVLGTLAYLGYNYSFLWVAKVYLIPYFHVNFWLVFITKLQHTDLKLPHYRSEDWNWLQGALCTVDRDYGFLNHVFHHIGDTHVTHHLFSKMPHYHAEEATRALIPVLGKYYCRDDTPLWKAVWNSTHHCQAVKPEGTKALWY